MRYLKTPSSQFRNRINAYPRLDWLQFQQGQARGYGGIIHKRGRTSGGHYFQDLFTAKPLDIHHFLGYQMKDLEIVFLMIPH